MPSLLSDLFNDQKEMSIVNSQRIVNLENASKKKQKLDCDLPAPVEVPAAVISPETNFHHQVLRTRLDSDGTIGRFDDISQDTPQDDANKSQ